MQKFFGSFAHGIGVVCCVFSVFVLLWKLRCSHLLRYCAQVGVTVGERLRQAQPSRMLHSRVVSPLQNREQV